jgi:formate C-acetyltransferase
MSMPMLVGDEETTAGLIRAGLEPEDAFGYCVVGCNELGVPGKLAWESVSVCEVDLLRQMVAEEDGAALPLPVEAAIPELGRRYGDVLRERVRAWQANRVRRARLVPTPLTSALMQGGLERGRDIALGARYDLLNVRSSGFTNLVNGLSALAAVTSGADPINPARVRSAMGKDYVGHEDVRARLRAAPTWGHDHQEADRWALAWLRERDAVLCAIAEQDGCPPLLAEMVVRSLHHVEGRRLPATPDGRRGGQPLCDSVGAEFGTVKKGVLSLLNSVRKLEPRRYWPGGYNLNLTLPGTTWEAASMRPRWLALIDTFFAGGGQELQINCLNSSQLREARRRPDQHRDVLVRVAGFNARFVDLSAVEQEEIIRRAEEAERTGR